MCFDKVRLFFSKAHIAEVTLNCDQLSYWKVNFITGGFRVFPIFSLDSNLKDTCGLLFWLAQFFVFK